ncbi:hypothetical protein BC830DRAFT_602519 [Chytriomyces sp. MP71]|nr:hypothetical protein BC830DRAFT_602519 [Chytriomyces sp. MP71]
MDPDYSNCCIAYGMASNEARRGRNQVVEVFCLGCQCLFMENNYAYQVTLCNAIREAPVPVPTYWSRFQHNLTDCEIRAKEEHPLHQLALFFPLPRRIDVTLLYFVLVTVTWVNIDCANRGVFNKGRGMHANEGKLLMRRLSVQPGLGSQWLMKQGGSKKKPLLINPAEVQWIWTTQPHCGALTRQPCGGAPTRLRTTRVWRWAPWGNRSQGDS